MRMQSRSFSRNVFIVLVASLVMPTNWNAPVTNLRAETSNSPALTGQVTSKEEGAMEGVLVSAKVGMITVTVVTNAEGRYAFPASRLKPAKYHLASRAVGYELPGSPSVEVIAKKTAKMDLTLMKTLDLASQLTTSEWVESFPGTDAQKSMFPACSSCHTMEPIAKSTHNAAEWVDTLKRMAQYSPPSTLAHPVLLPYTDEAATKPETLRQRSEYLATVNLSSGRPWKFPLKTLPRPKGEATRVIITEYDLPREDAQPHDVILDSEGMAWFADFALPYLARLNLKTGEVKEYPLPELKPGFPPGALGLQLDKEGSLWVAQLMQAGISRFDRKTGKFTTWSAPKEYNNDPARAAMVAPLHHDVDGKVWFDNAGTNMLLHRLDIATGKIDTYSLYGDQKAGHSIYDVATDSENNAYFTDMVGGNIGKVDAKTGKITLYPTPTPNSGPRRLQADSQDRLWIGEFYKSKIAMFDTKTAKFQEWATPSPWSSPYDVVLDKHGEAWTSGMGNDRVVRLNPKTGHMVEYLLPRPANIRRVFVDDSTTPATLWIGNNHGASVVKMEALD